MLNRKSQIAERRAQSADCRAQTAERKAQSASRKSQFIKQRNIECAIAGLALILLTAHLSMAESADDYLWENYLKGEYSLVIESGDERLRHLSGRKIAEQIYYLKGLSFLKMGQAIAARRNFNLLLGNYPNSRWGESAQLSLGDCFLIERRLYKASESYEDFIAKNKKADLLSLAYFKLAEVKRKSGLWDEARSLHEKIRRKFPHSLEASLAGAILSNDEFYYTFQLGSFLNRENARELKRKLKDAGFPAYIVEKVKLGRVFYRVRVGKLSEYDEVAGVRKKLTKKGYSFLLYP